MSLKGIARGRAASEIEVVAFEDGEGPAEPRISAARIIAAPARASSPVEAIADEDEPELPFTD